VANPEVTDENEFAAESSSEANPSQAAAAASIGPEPAPPCICTEVMSGGNTEKFIAVPIPGWRLGLRAGRTRYTEIYDELRRNVGSSRSVCHRNTCSASTPPDMRDPDNSATQWRKPATNSGCPT